MSRRPGQPRETSRGADVSASQEATTDFSKSFQSEASQSTNPSAVRGTVVTKSLVGKAIPVPVKKKAALPSNMFD